MPWNSESLQHFTESSSVLNAARMFADASIPRIALVSATMHNSDSLSSAEQEVRAAFDPYDATYIAAHNALLNPVQLNRDLSQHSSLQPQAQYHQHSAAAHTTTLHAELAHQLYQRHNEAEFQRLNAILKHNYEPAVRKLLHRTVAAAAAASAKQSTKQTQEAADTLLQQYNEHLRHITQARHQLQVMMHKLEKLQKRQRRAQQQHHNMHSFTEEQQAELQGDIEDTRKVEDRHQDALNKIHTAVVQMLKVETIAHAQHQQSQIQSNL